ncbi:MAG: hypothetical protein ABIP97_02015 [Chthoniobacterales bacterium]
MSDFRKHDLEGEVEEFDLSTEELDTQVHKAQEQLLELRRQQEQIEKEKLKLEELSRKQEELDRGCGEMVDKFNRALAVIQRESIETQKRTDQLQSIQEIFTAHLRHLDGINVRSWNGPELPRELGKGLSSVEDARSEYDKLYPKIGTDAQDEVSYAASASEYDEYGSGEKSFFYWFMMGLAFTLPLIIVGALMLVVLFWHFASTH